VKWRYHKLLLQEAYFSICGEVLEKLFLRRLAIMTNKRCKMFVWSGRMDAGVYLCGQRLSERKETYTAAM
jgi:hypothetical protein